MTKWKSLLCAAAAAYSACALLTGCVGGGSACLAPQPPKTASAQLKFAGRDVPLYEYCGAELPALEGGDSCLAVTKDAIYGIQYMPEEKKYHLQKMRLKDGIITDVEDLGIVRDAPVTSDGTNIYYITRTDEIAMYNGKAAVMSAAPSTNIVRAVFGAADGYTSLRFLAGSDVMRGTLSKEGLKDAKTVLSKDVFGALSNNHSETEENNAFLIWADRDGFYVSTIATHGGMDKDEITPLHFYDPGGRKIRTFACNMDLPSDAEKYPQGERSAIVTRDYVVFYGQGYMRAFAKADGKHVGDVALTLDDRKLSPSGAAADDTNNIYFIHDKTHIYRIDL